MTNFPRSSGLLLHVTSLPGAYGIGDLGQAAYEFVDRLVDAGQSVWQVLPLTPTGYADSPYQSLSSFAGNTNLISLDKLVEAGWLTRDDLADTPPFPADRVDYGWVLYWREPKLARAYERFNAQASPADRERLWMWCADNAFWLDDFALFMALKRARDLQAWVTWERGLALREPDTIKAAQTALAGDIEQQRFRQWVFFEQWGALRHYANSQGVRLVGDTPIYVAHDSCDVWASPVYKDDQGRPLRLFDLDENGQPQRVAGVPPDYFSATGQYWGNPLYYWHVHEQHQFDWWIKRIDAALKLVDIVRIDHFRGFYNYWEVPANEERTAANGRWLYGPKEDFFDALGEERKRRIIAEDLGAEMIYPIRLRRKLGLPGMAVLQFAFGGSPEERERFMNPPDDNLIVYTGTHDNNTTLGWWTGDATEWERTSVLQTLGVENIDEPHWAMIELGMRYKAHTLIIPLQDLLGLDESARMNRPSVESGNWQWRCTADQLASADWSRLRALTEQHHRLPK